ncbi:MAG: ABC transporter permease subunit [Legionellales bacterium]|nr:ABC transporter permease subunit [Legionellales bacterium]
MEIKPVILWTDALIYLLVIALIASGWWIKRKAHLRAAWRQVLSNRLALMALVILGIYFAIGLLDSIHFQRALPSTEQQVQPQYSAQVDSLFDVLISPLGQRYEKTYSAPFALHGFVKESTRSESDQFVSTYARLQYAGIGVASQMEKLLDILWRITSGIVAGLAVWGISLLVILAWQTYWKQQSFRAGWQRLWRKQPTISWRLLALTALVMLMLIGSAMLLAQNYHLLGTDKVGQDIFYLALKSIRTGLVIGTLTTLVMLPFALGLGIAAGYFSGIVDDIIQYIYTTLSSIPGVLLIASAILSLQIFIANHPQVFANLAQRDDARLLALCFILGITSWTSLCRLLRGETLKVREMDYVQAAIALGVRKITLLVRHILPNVMHIVLIVIILDFSALVLAEAVLSYVGVGVAPSTISWGNMINSARLELAREPVVWWPITAAFVFMFILVLAANLFADSVRDALDPRTK